MAIKRFIFILFSFFVFAIPLCANSKSSLGFRAEKKLKEQNEKSAEDDVNNLSEDSAEESVEESWQ